LHCAFKRCTFAAVLRPRGRQEGVGLGWRGGGARVHSCVLHPAALPSTIYPVLRSILVPTRSEFPIHRHESHSSRAAVPASPSLERQPPAYAFKPSKHFPIQPEIPSNVSTCALPARQQAPPPSRPPQTLRALFGTFPGPSKLPHEPRSSIFKIRRRRTLPSQAAPRRPAA
jgi:hypothetical protein